VHVGEDISDLVAGEDHWKSRGPFSAIYLIDPGERFPEDLIIEEEQSAKGLVLGRGADVALDGEVGEEGSDFGFGHFNRVTFVVKEDEASYPEPVSFFCPAAVMFGCYGFVDEITKSGCGHGRLPPDSIKRAIPAWGPSSMDILESR
jgi:hypothetical protein